MDAVLGATIQVVLQNVLSSISEIKLVLGEQDLTQLSSYLEMIEQYLADAEAKRVGSRAVQLWLNQLEDVAFEADAVLDEVKYELLRRQVKKQNGASNQVLGSMPSAPRKLIFKLKMSGEIKHVITKLEKINKDATSYGLQMAVAVASKTNTSTPPERETDSFSVEPYIEGRENDVSEIVEKLVTAPPQETISVIPIVGMGGIGKTTLARQVFHHDKIGNHFAEKIWVCVSFNFDSVSLFKTILETLTQEEANVTKEAVLQKIQKRLAGKRYLLVLDDIWNEKYEKWDEFMIPLSRISDVKGNCIVVTTRKENVASDVGTLPTHRLLGLSATQCWSIIKAETFPRVDVRRQFEILGKCIAEKCGGLPLAAKVVGGLLRGKSEEDWRSILENKLSDCGKDDGDEKIKKILRLSYDNLPSLPLKKCFAYCSVLPQDFKIRRQRLIELWMAEGFLQADNKGNDMETVGNNFFNHLLQYSLFQDAERDFFGDIVLCKMHDLIHDLACSITKDMLKVRYLAIESTTNEPPTILPEQMMYLRTLFFNGKIANHLFSNFKCLHVLKLTGKEIKELPPVIEKLIHLRSLDISGTKIECLPDSIGKLYHLQTLWVARYLNKLPNTMIDLVSLRHMHISYLTELPPGIGKLTYIQTLPYYNVRDEKGCRIGELGNLKNLKGVLKIVNLQRVKDKEDAELADLYKKPGIVKLVFKWNESRDGERKDENVLDGLQPHPRLKYLEISGYEGRNFPLWTMRMAARNEEALDLIEIKLTKCTRCEELPMLGRLPHLRFLELDNLCNVQSIGPSFYGCENFAKPKTAFPSLEKLKLLDMPELSDWVDMKGAVTVFPCLKELKIIDCPKLKSLQNRFTCLNYLKIRNCPKLNSLQSHFPRLKILKVYNVDTEYFLRNVCCNTSNLEELTIGSCQGLKSIPYDARGGLASLRILRIEDCQGLTDLPIELLESCASSLEELRIDSCPGLKTIVPYDARGGQSQQGLTSLRKLIIKNCLELTDLPIELIESCSSSLEELEIHCCWRLKLIPYDGRGGQSQQGLTSLRKLKIEVCHGLTYLPIELLESCTSSLETLSLFRLGKLENLDTLIACVWRMPRLQHLTLWHVPKLTIFPAENSCLSNLRRLDIGGLSESINLDKLNRLFLECRSLEHLLLIGKEDWDSLPNQIQHLTSLQTLRLSNFGIEALPEWIGNLSSLQELNICNCKRLRHLPSKEAMQRLSKLQILGIEGLSESINLDKLNRLFRECRSLEVLFLGGKEDWDSLPNQIQQFTALRQLFLHDFGIEALPEWIGNLSSLETLEIWNCKRLRHLPSKEAMQRLSKLSGLRIHRCPLLKVERCSPSQQQSTTSGAADDSEWPKISHIQDVYIDYRLLPTRN